MKHLTCTIYFILIGISIIPAEAQSKKIEKLWNEVKQCVYNENSEKVRSLCKELIIKAELYDSLAILSRQLLAELYLIEENMNGIYEQYAFFRSYRQQSNDNNQYTNLENRLKQEYDRLLNIDKTRPISEGIYVSTSQHTRTHQPAILIEIKKVGNTYRARMLPGCGIYKSKRYIKAIAEQQDILLNENDSTFNIFWGNTRVKNPDTETAHSVINSVQNFKADMYSEQAVRNMSIGETVAATGATELAGALFLLFGKYLATGSKKAYSILLKWTPQPDGRLQATFSYRFERMSTTDVVSENEEKTIKLHLYKIYPHYEIFFYHPSAKGYISYKQYDDEKEFKKFHPTFLTTRGKNLLRNKPRINAEMYKEFAWNFIFARLRQDTVARFAPPLEEMECYTNDSILHLGKYSKKYGFIGFAAMLHPEGIIEFAQQVNNLQTDKMESAIYINDGSYRYGNYINGKMNGYCLWRYPNGEKMFEGTLHNDQIVGQCKYYYENGQISYQGEMYEGKRHGQGTINYANGGCYTGTFNKGKFLDGMYTYQCADFKFNEGWKEGKSQGATIIYTNGDSYYGEANNHLPHGKGTMTYANGKKVYGEWEKGVKKNTPTKNNIKK